MKYPRDGPRGYSCKYAFPIFLADSIIGQKDRKVNYGTVLYHHRPGDSCGNASLYPLMGKLASHDSMKCPLCLSVGFGKRLFLYKSTGPYSYIGRLFFSAYIAFKKAFSVSVFPGSWGQNRTPSGNCLYRTQEWGTGRLALAEKLPPGGRVFAASFRDMTYPGRFILVKSVIPAHCQTVKKSKSNRGILQKYRGLAVVFSNG